VRPHRCHVALKECFDAPCTESASAHLILGVCWSQLGDQAKRHRFLQFADMISRELHTLPADFVIVLELLRVSASLVLLQLLLLQLHACF
jgi:hypothetical protein